MKKKILIAYYSKTGNNRKITEELGGLLGADTDEIIPEFKYEGFKGFLKAGFGAMRKKTIGVSSSKSPSEYKLVIVGGPLWAGSLSVPLRSYIKKNKFNNLAFFSCCGKGQPQKSLRQLSELNIIPREALFVPEKELKENLHHEKIINFSDSIKKIKSKPK